MCGLMTDLGLTENSSLVTFVRMWLIFRRIPRDELQSELITYGTDHEGVTSWHNNSSQCNCLIFSFLHRDVTSDEFL